MVAAVFALGGIAFAAQPADRNHPYGHGKIEFFSAAFEGGLIAFAAVLIIYEVVQAFLHGVEVRALDAGLAIVVGAGLANLALGLYLLRVGRRVPVAHPGRRRQARAVRFLDQRGDRGGAAPRPGHGHLVARPA